MATLLIVDDEAHIRNGLKTALASHAYKILTASDGLHALSLLKSEPVDLIISDIKMPKMDGLTLQEEALKINPKQLIILLTAYGSLETAVEAMRRGAYDFLTKPIHLDKFEMVVERALSTRKLEEENQRLKEELEKNQRLGNIIGRSKIMQDLFEKIKAIAETKSNVLFYGECGTGKELIASAIHRLSARRNEAFIPVHCAALSEGLLESELFGHEKGAFTGAISKKEGRFKLADKGTLFLDEIGELSPLIQVKLLRVLQEKTFEPVGSDRFVKVDVRFIFATHKNLQQEVEKGFFREDLYYRIHVAKIESPSLRQRKEDIPLLVNHFLNFYCQEMGKEPKSLHPEALNALVRYDWPGNVRELQNIIENLVIFSSAKVIPSNALPDSILNPVSHEEDKKNVSSTNLVENEKKLITQALQDCKYNKTSAALQLGLSRRTIHRKIKEYGLDQ